MLSKLVMGRHGAIATTGTGTRTIRYRTLRNQPGGSLWTAIEALHRAYSLGRDMTLRERFLLAFLGCPPTHSLTLHGPPGTTVADWWVRYRKRINRERASSRTLIYFGVQADGLGHGGEHLHLLLWDDEWFPFWVFQRHAEESGLGKLHIDQVPDPHVDLLGCAHMVTYVLSQHEPVFGSDHHERHHAPRRHQRRWIRPHRATLRRHRPQLLSALDDAESSSISDKELVSRVLTFSKTTGTRRDNDESV